MKIYTLTGITNSYSMGYYSYLASVESWMKAGEKVIVADGWSDDGSIEKLYDFLSQSEHHQLEIIKNDTTFWSKDYFFHVSQLNIAFNNIIENTDCDWLIVVNADYVFDGNSENLEKQLSKHDNELVVKFKRYKSNGEKTVFDERGIIINIKLARNKNIPVRFGFREDNRGLSDFPIVATKKSCFRDSNGAIKTIYKGQHIVTQAVIDIECGVYGHFFFSDEQCMYKCKRWSNAISRFYGIPLEEDGFLKYQNKILKGIKSFSLEELKQWKHPKDIIRVIDTYYTPDMMGARETKLNKFHTLIENFYKFKRKITHNLFTLFKIPSLEKLHQWHDIEEKNCIISFDLKKIYLEQNKAYSRLLGKV